uniref:ANK_REP_REGION domain-containing protein n=1 Tax=Heterorhabditis bacteriophora TaxID=37862 RepID=A0A1I7XCF9_HETBA
MSVRVRFSQDRPGVTYVPPNENVDSFVKDILAKPMPPLHKEDNFEMDPFTAASIGDANVLQNLQMKKSFNPNQKNSSDWTPLLYAAYLGHHAVCSFLIDAGAKLDDCNRRGQTALMLASACGNLQVVDALLLAGADPNAKDSEGMTPLLEACASGHELTAISLIEKSGDPSIRNCRGEDGSMLAAESPKILQLIKEKKQDQFLRGIMIEHSRHTRQPRTLAELLDAMNLSRLAARFEAENIDLKLFFDLNEKIRLCNIDFEEMGIAYVKKYIITLHFLCRIRSLLTAIIEGAEKITTRVARHDV